MRKKSGDGTGFYDSAFARLSRETAQSPILRTHLLRDIAEHFDSTVVTYVSSFKLERPEISDDDAEMLESLLAAEHPKGKRLILIINSPGGQALAAERIVNVCRAYGGGDFEVLIPHMAKSAATMICFGAKTIHMSSTAELGPVDPQVTYKDDAGDPRGISAAEYLRSYERLLEKADKAKKIEPFMLLLQRYDARYLEKLRSHQKLSEDISVSLLRTGMMRGKTIAQIRRAIQVFLSQTQTSAHGRMINADGARKCGLKILDIDLRSDVWGWVWEYYIRSNWAVDRCGKLMESGSSALTT